MLKSRLIELLNNIEGNPEIKLWNGFVQDWVNISPNISPMVLSRMTKAYWFETVRMEGCIDRKDWEYELSHQDIEELEKQYPTGCKWEDNQYVSEEDIKSKRYKQRTVYVIQAKQKKEEYFDRVGSVSY
jgi:hypothetical protein